MVRFFSTVSEDKNIREHKRKKVRINNKIKFKNFYT